MVQPLVRAPEFAPGIWLNSAHPLRLAALRGRAVLVDLWNYTCFDCLRALPYVQTWAQRYSDRGLTTVSVHVSEFAFGRERTQVELALQELGIDYPVLLDNDFAMWNAYASRFLPTRILIDSDGLIRAQHEGKGAFAAFERAIQSVLREIDPDVELPPPLHDEAAPEHGYQEPTPDLRGGYEGGALGNPEGYARSAPILYGLPEQRSSGAFYVSGAWQANHEALTYRGTTEGIIQLPYEAVEVKAILSPHYDTVERMLHPEVVSVEIWQDDLPLSQDRRGADTTEDGRILVDRPRVYHLIRNPGFERHELTLRVRARGFALYTFSFVGGARRRAK